MRALEQEFRDRVPVLVVWAKDDPVVSFMGRKGASLALVGESGWLAAFVSARLVAFCVRSASGQGWSVLQV